MKRETISQKIQRNNILNDITQNYIDWMRFIFNLITNSVLAYLIVIFTIPFVTFIFQQSTYPIEVWKQIPSLLAWAFASIFFIFRLSIPRKGFDLYRINYENGRKLGYLEGWKACEKRGEWGK